MDIQKNPTQMALPIEVRPEEVARKQSLGAAIELCAELKGFEPKELADELRSDRAQVSRWYSDSEGILWKKLEKVMDVCGNDAPVLWMLYQRGYDLNSLRKRESETEKQLRIEREARIAAEDKLRYAESLLRGVSLR